MLWSLSFWKSITFMNRPSIPLLLLCVRVHVSCESGTLSTFLMIIYFTFLRIRPKTNDFHGSRLHAAYLRQVAHTFAWRDTFWLDLHSGWTINWNVPILAQPPNPLTALISPTHPPTDTHARSNYVTVMTMLDINRGKTPLSLWQV